MLEMDTFALKKEAIYVDGEVITSYASYAIPEDQRTALPTITALFNHQYLESEWDELNATSRLQFRGMHEDGNHTCHSQPPFLPKVRS